MREAAASLTTNMLLRVLYAVLSSATGRPSAVRYLVVTAAGILIPDAK